MREITIKIDEDQQIATIDVDGFRQRITNVMVNIENVADGDATTPATSGAHKSVRGARMSITVSGDILPPTK